jgi:hypothetical protein
LIGIKIKSNKKTMLIDIDTYLAKKHLQFNSNYKKLSWIKSLKPETLVRIGTSTVVDDEEMDLLYIRYIERQVKIRKKRQQSAKRAAATKKQKVELNK